MPVIAMFYGIIVQMFVLDTDAALKNPAYFQSVFVAYGTVCWPEGEDFSPETLAARAVC